LIIISFWSTSPFISMECPSLSRLINVGLNQELLDGRGHYLYQRASHLENSLKGFQTVYSMNSNKTFHGCH
jgi:hypothetical protein